MRRERTRRGTGKRRSSYSEVLRITNDLTDGDTINILPSGGVAKG